MSYIDDILNHDIVKNFKYQGVKLMVDTSFIPQRKDLEKALDVILSPRNTLDLVDLPETLPNEGIGEEETINLLAPMVVGPARKLGGPDAFAHMDPPTPWITWVSTFWNAALNQNLLHPDLSPVAKDMERRVIDWISPYFGMDGGHMTPGSTISNLTALWAARDLRHVKKVIASEASHLSISKAAHLLGLKYVSVKTDNLGRLDPARLPSELSDAALVLTAGTTNAGAIDDLTLFEKASWTHVDAAWAGPLRLSQKFASRLDGIEKADSISVSAHKWFFQPKEAGIILFRETKIANSALSFGGSYISAPNVGLLGSHGAIAIPLLATLLSWGRSGIAQRVERAMMSADTLWQRLNEHPKVELFSPQTSGVVLWRLVNEAKFGLIYEHLPEGSTSQTRIHGIEWFRNVAANPCVDIDRLWKEFEGALDRG